jgi:hypothetical protein
MADSSALEEGSPTSVPVAETLGRRDREGTLVETAAHLMGMEATLQTHVRGG